MRWGTLTLALFMLLVVANSQESPDKIEISDFPEFAKVAYNHSIYAGYLNISIYDKAFYYFFFKSQSEQDHDPVVLWLNGGPGCSSLMGAFTENGPFLFEKTKQTIVMNPYAWNQNAHILYLESPAGVGFSKGNSHTSNDTATAQDNYMALVKFFERFESLKDNDFYLAGESYAGVYIPLLADQIISQNQQESSQDRKINLKGVLLGNACTHPTECYTPSYLSRYQVEFLNTRGFVDAADYSHYQSACLDIDEKSKDCVDVQKKIHDDFYSSLANIYNVYDVCYPSTKLSQPKPEFGIYRHALHCSDAVGSTHFFNKNEYRAKLHIGQLNDTLKWTPCSDNINYTIESRQSYSFLPTLVRYGLKVWYFSGDFDAMVPIQGTLSWLQKYRRDYGAAIKKNWRPWLWGDNKLGGMVWELEGITFFSVIGAGHMVPSDQPQAALHLFNSFIGRAGEPVEQSQE